MADFESIFIDIGEGDSTLLRLPGDQYALIDVFRCEDHGSIDLWRLLDDRLPDGGNGKKRLEYLIITHAHDDHIRGLKELVERYDVGEIWAPRYKTEKPLGDKFEEFKEVVESHDNVVVPQGSRTPIAHLGEDGSVEVRCFSPPGYVDVEEDLSEEDAVRYVHEHCGVFRFTFAGISIMFTGDSDLKCWQRIESYYEGRTDENDLGVLESEIVHASHHGSRTFFKVSKDDEPSLDALEAIKPDSVIVSVGEANRHEHPHEDAMKAYRDEVGDDHVLETQHAQTIVVEVEADGNYQLIPDDGSFEADYGWTNDGDDEATEAARTGSLALTGVRRRSKTRLDNSSAA